MCCGFYFTNMALNLKLYFKRSFNSVDHKLIMINTKLLGIFELTICKQKYTTRLYNLV